jgi:hypothetical protein
VPEKLEGATRNENAIAASATSAIMAWGFLMNIVVCFSKTTAFHGSQVAAVAIYTVFFL